jgi:competence protein ComEC
VRKVLLVYPYVLAGAACAGLALSNMARGSALAVALLAVGAAFAAAFMADPRARIALLALALLLAGWWWGSLRLNALDSSVLAPLAGQRAAARLVVTGPARTGRFDLRVPAKLTRFGSIRTGEPVLLQLPLGRAPPQGAILELDARLKLPRPAANGFDERTWLRRHGVHVVAQAADWRIVGRRGGIGGYAERVRAWLARSLAPGLTGERRAVLEGIVLGEDEDLSPGLQDAFRASGLYHLLAVSGSNVMFVALGVLGLAWVLGLPRWLGHLGALAGIGSYVLAVGAQPSVIRAGIAGALGSLAWLAARDRDRWHFLLVGALLLLAWSPYTLLDAGFQLSFAAVAAIFLVVPRTQRFLEGYPVPKKLADVVAISFACGVVTAPILVLQFGRIPLYSVPANALAAAVVAPLLALSFAAALANTVSPAAAAMIASVNGWLAAYLSWCARFVAGLPGAVVSSDAGLGALLLVSSSLVLAVRLSAEPRPRRA